MKCHYDQKAVDRDNLWRDIAKKPTFDFVMKNMKCSQKRLHYLRPQSH